VRLAWLGPEIGDREFAVEIRAEVVHDADWEENVHSELVGLVSYMRERVRLGFGRSALGRVELWWAFSVVMRGVFGEPGLRTLKTSRLGPPILAVCDGGGLGLAARLETLALKWSDDGDDYAQIWSVMVRR
jgi:hypothetical protein